MLEYLPTFKWKNAQPWLCEILNLVLLGGVYCCMNPKILVVGAIIALMAVAGLLIVKQGRLANRLPATPMLIEPENKESIPDLPLAEAENELLESTEPEPPLVETPPEPAEPLPSIVEPPAELPSSDKIVQKAVADLSATLAKWFMPEEQVRKWVLLVENVATGTIPVKNRPLSFKMSKFVVNEKPGEMRMSESNFARLNPILDTVVDLDPDLLVHYYKSWQPLFEDAYSELGQPATFHERLLQAIDQVLAIDPFAAPNAKLEQPKVFYTFANPELEKATDLEKFFWRMGPENAARVQLFLQLIQARLIAPERVPQ